MPRHGKTDRGGARDLIDLARAFRYLAAMGKYGTCILCGEHTRLTREHSPPRAAFSTPYPDNLITVPACRQCNEATSTLDFGFGVFLAFNCGHASEEGERLWNDRREGLRADEKLVQDLRRRIVPASPEQAARGAVAGISGFNPHDYAPIYDKCFRALYFKEFKRIYPIDLKMVYAYPEAIDERLSDVLPLLRKRNVGGNHVFFSAMGHADEAPDAFVACMVFYGTFVVVAFPADLQGMGERLGLTSPK
jgi:hypothetical protein